MRAFKITPNSAVKDETHGKSLYRIWKKPCRLNPNFWNKIWVAYFIADGKTEPSVKIVNKVAKNGYGLSSWMYWLKMDRECNTLDIWPWKFGEIVTDFNNVRTSREEVSDPCKLE